MTEPTQQQRIDRLAEWMGWYRREHYPLWWCARKDGQGRCAAAGKWNPFADLNDARLLLDECERRGLNHIHEVACRILANKFGNATTACRMGLLATATQLTEAVEVVAELGENNGTEAKTNTETKARTAPDATPDA